MDSKDKVKIYVKIQPLSITFGQVFKRSETFNSILNFVVEQVKKIGVNYKIGRINENKTGAIILSDSIIGDFLTDNDEITIYSEDYGFVSNSLPGDNENNSSKKIFYHKNVSDFYKPFSFLNKKRKGSKEINEEAEIEKEEKEVKKISPETIKEKKEFDGNNKDKQDKKEEIKNNNDNNNKGKNDLNNNKDKNNNKDEKNKIDKNVGNNNENNNDKIKKKKHKKHKKKNNSNFNNENDKNKINIPKNDKNNFNHFKSEGKNDIKFKGKEETKKIKFDNHLEETQENYMDDITIVIVFF